MNMNYLLKKKKITYIRLQKYINMEKQQGGVLFFSKK